MKYILLVLGASMVAGGLKYKTQSCNAMAAGMNSTLLLSTAGLVVPALFYYLLNSHEVPPDQIGALDLDVSLDVSILLFVTYILSLVISPLEVLAIILSAILVNFVALDGQSHWMEGVQLLAVYFVLGIAFYFLPPWKPAAAGSRASQWSNSMRKSHCRAPVALIST